jgi:alkylated DNA repair dioxygenase AlkB
MTPQLDLFQIAKAPYVDLSLNKIKGLQYIPNFITRNEEQQLLKTIDNQVWINDLKRRVQHYGFKYDYKARRIDHSMRLGNLPEWLDILAYKLFELGYFNENPDQVIVNEYEIGQGISPHIDCEPCFEDTVISLSLNSTAVMEFINENSLEKIPVLLEPRSIVVLKGESRYHWKHTIPARQKDIFDGIIFNRKRRVSLTFRKVII